MRRFLWVALLSVCSACSAPSGDDKDNAPANGAAENSTPTDSAAVPDLTKPVSTLGPSEPTNPGDVAAADNTAESAACGGITGYARVGRPDRTGRQRGPG